MLASTFDREPWITRLMHLHKSPELPGVVHVDRVAELVK